VKKEGERKDKSGEEKGRRGSRRREGCEGGEVREGEELF
jgi:hypothetical protein